MNLREKLAKRHIRREFYQGQPTPNRSNHGTGSVHECAHCHQIWPCDTRQLLDILTADNLARAMHEADFDCAWQIKTDPREDHRLCDPTSSRHRYKAEKLLQAVENT